MAQALTTAAFLKAFAPILRGVGAQTDDEFADDAAPIWLQYLQGDARLARIIAEITSTVTFENRAIELMADWYAGTATGGPFNNGLYPLRNAEGEEYLVPSPAKLVQEIAKGDPGRDARHNTIINVQYAFEANEETPPYSPPENVLYDAAKSFCYARFNTETAPVVIALLMNGVQWGTATFPAGQTEGVVAFVDPNHLRGSLLTARGPATPAPGLSQIGITLAGASED